VDTTTVHTIINDQHQFLLTDISAFGSEPIILLTKAQHIASIQLPQGTGSRSLPQMYQVNCLQRDKVTRFGHLGTFVVDIKVPTNQSPENLKYYATTTIRNCDGILLWYHKVMI
jgi:hypothetical protein